ncbi:MAG: tRNA 2-selenouridine(34) synthase MnmH [Paracoccaceae bacterium]
MAASFDSLNTLIAHGFDTVIDARSPAEFTIDHIPGAINLPVLSNQERASVGTIYKQVSPFDAKKTGAALLAQNVARHLQGPLADYDGAWQPLVYCWRGGQRSGAFATILQQVGWRAQVLEGGYQTYRRLVSAAMHTTALAHKLIVLDGNTGTAKTALLHLLAARGHQMVDLEGLAAHRGSVFGAVDQAQPSQKAFEGALAGAFAGLDANRPVLVEAESSKIGRVLIPPSVWQAMKIAPRISVTAPLCERAAYLVGTYTNITRDPAVLQDRLAGLVAHQGRAQVDEWQAMAACGDMEPLAQGLMQAHYDPSYTRSRSKHAAVSMGVVHSDSLADAGLSKTVDRLEELLAASVPV